MNFSEFHGEIHFGFSVCERVRITSNYYENKSKVIWNVYFHVARSLSWNSLIWMGPRSQKRSLHKYLPTFDLVAWCPDFLRQWLETCLEHVPAWAVEQYRKRNESRQHFCPQSSRFANVCGTCTGFLLKEPIQKKQHVLDLIQPWWQLRSSEPTAVSQQCTLSQLQWIVRLFDWSLAL